MTRVKVCGITRHEDAELAVELGAWALGFILWPHSPRAADPAVAAGIAAALRRRVELVGVFVNATLDEVAHAADALHLSHVQLHGDEGPVFCAEAARRTGAKVIKAVRVAGAGRLPGPRALPHRLPPARHRRARAARRHGRDVGLGARGAPAAQGPRRSSPAG